MRVVLFFIDGLGLAPESVNNPLATTPTPHLNLLLDGRNLCLETVGFRNSLATLKSLDATLGVAGCPQSATGQTTLFTGINASAAVGCHVRGFPNAKLRKILSSEGILKKIKDAGFSPTFLNCYRPDFFAELSAGKKFFSATTMLNYYAGLPFRTLEDLVSGDGVYSDISCELVRSLGYDVPLVTPELAGERLARVAQRFDFLLFEHFLTDVTGHKRDRDKAAYLIHTIDRFIGSMLAHLDLQRTLLVVTSDHGNLEDISSGTHTRNPVPLLLVGGYQEVPLPVSDLTGVAPMIMHCLGA
jgi:hypothetical protein